MLTVKEKYYGIAARMLLVLIGVIVVLTFRHYGVTWDEELQSQYGLAVVDYYLSLFQDHRFDEIFNLYLYGGMFDGMASLIDRFSPFGLGLYETRHLLNALVGLVGLWGTWRLGRLIGGSAVGLASLVMLTLVPMYYGHMFNNPKDIPFAAGVIWSLYYMGRCFLAMPRVPRRLIVKLGLVYGLTLGVRVGGVMLLAFWIAVLGLGCLQEQFNSPPLGEGVGEGADVQRRRTPHQQKPSTCFASAGFCVLSRKGRGIISCFSDRLRMIIPVAAIAYIVMLICWPWAQQNPVLNPLRALGQFSNFPQDVEVLLDGTTYRSTQLPWFYVPLYFGVQLPEFLLLLLAASFPLMPRLWTRLDQPRRQLLLLMLMMGLVPIIYAILRHPALYDAVRHFLFAVPLACIVAAMTAREMGIWIVGRFGQVGGARRLMIAGLAIMAAAIMAVQIDIMVRLHPYEYIYASSLAGGVAGAYGRYELDYWGSSFKEAAQRLQAFVAREGGVPPGKIYKIAICGPWSAAMIYLPPDYEPVIANEPAEFFLSTTRWMCPKMRPGRDIIEVRRMGAPLAVIKDLRNGFEYYEGNSKKK